MLHYFTDAILRAPTIASMLMCFSAALVGVLVFLRKQSLLGESLSHAAYPGVIVGILSAGSFYFSENQIGISALIIAGAFLAASLGYAVIHFLTHRLKFRSDATLCFVLAAFFGIGITLASLTQFEFPHLYRQVQIYLYGQAATMTDIHIGIYSVLALLIVLILVMFFKELQVLTFDRAYAKSIGIPIRLIETILFGVIVLAIVVGIRSVGVVLMSAMLIAPAVSARQFTHHLGALFCLSGIIGLFSGFMGNYLSIELSQYLTDAYAKRMALPTGPMIVIVASTICFLSLLVARRRRQVYESV